MSDTPILIRFGPPGSGLLVLRYIRTGLTALGYLPGPDLAGAGRGPCQQVLTWRDAHACRRRVANVAS